MSEGSPVIPDLQTALAQLEQVGQAAASPFIKSDAGKATEGRVLSEVNLGVAALPLLGSLFSAIAGLFHHAHAVVSAAKPAALVAVTAPAPASSTEAVK